MRKLVIGFLMLSLLVAGGCAAAPPRPPLPTPAVSPSAATVSASPSPSVKPVVPVATPWRIGMFQYGIQLYWHTGGSREQIQQAADRSLDYVVGLGANSVGISFPIYTDGVRPTRVYIGPETPDAASLGVVLAAAKARNLRVMLRPIVDEANIMSAGNGAWRGSIKPVNVADWFADYDQLLVGYAVLARQYGVDELAVGTELTSLQSQTTQWKQLLDQVGATGYTGSVSYAVNENHLSSVPVQVLGLDAYPVVNLGDGATVAQLTSAIAKWFNGQPLSARKRMTVQEAGIPALPGMYKHPWQWGTGGGTLNTAVQANWFQAMCQAAKASQMQGLYYWMLDSNAEPSQASTAQQPSGSWLGRPAEQSIKRCFSAS